MKTTQLKRIGAFLIDMFLVGIISSLFETIFSNIFELKNYSVFGVNVKVSLSSNILFYAVYFFSFTQFRNAVTIGKMIFGLQVLLLKNKPITKALLYKRTGLKLISILLLPLSILVFIFGSYTTLHDFVAKTKVE